MRNQQSARRPTISDVAAMAGVSSATVSRVLNGTAPVAESTVQRVRQAIAMLDYTPHAAARTLAANKTNTVGLLLPEISGGFFAPMLRGVEAGVRENGYELLIYAALPTLSPLGTVQRPLGEHNTDGLLVFTDYLSDAEIGRLHRNGFPLVLLHRSSPNGLEIPCVTFENNNGARQLVEHLIAVHGYRRIAFLTGPQDNEDSELRELGYRQALAAHNIPFDPALVGMGNYTAAEGRAATERWLMEGVEIEAIFAGDDEAASGVITALKRAGKRVPGDVAVVGFDDVPFASLMSPPLTTVRAPIELAGRTAAERLVALIEGREAAPMTVLPTQVVIRQSCGCS